MIQTGFSQEKISLIQMKQTVAEQLNEISTAFNYAPQLGLWVDGKKCDNREFSHQNLIEVCDSITGTTFIDGKKVNNYIHLPLVDSQASSHWEKDEFSYYYTFDSLSNKLIHLSGPTFGIEKYFQYDEQHNLTSYYEKFGDKPKGQRFSIKYIENTETRYLDNSLIMSSIKTFSQDGHLINWITFPEGKENRTSYAELNYKWDGNQLIYFRHTITKKGKINSDKEVKYKTGKGGVVKKITRKDLIKKSKEISTISWSSKVNDSGLWEIQAVVDNQPKVTYIFDERGNWIEREFHDEGKKETRTLYYK